MQLEKPPPLLEPTRQGWGTQNRGRAASAMVRERKIIVSVATSADGFIARCDGSFDWLNRPRPKDNYGMDAFYGSIDTILWGRKTCDMALDLQKKGAAGTGFDTRVKNYVFTHNPPQAAAPAGGGVLNETINAVCSPLREEGGEDVWIL